MKGRSLCLTALSALALVACQRDSETKKPSGPTVTVPVQGWSPPKEGGPRDGSSAHTDAATPNAITNEAGIAVAYETAKALGGRSIGHTSVVFKLTLEGGLVAAYKPRSTRGPWRYKGEIAAYRLGKALALPNVPVAMPRSFSLEPLAITMGGKSADAASLFLKEAIPDDTGVVPGALIPWIPHLAFLALEEDPLLSQWKGWLSGKDEIPEDKKHLAAQVSTMVVFDYVTGNWDRWSGGNVGYDKEKDLVLFIDNDGAFYERPPPPRLALQRERLSGVNRFSRSFVDALGKLDDDALKAVFGDETPGVPLLSDKVRRGVRARIVDAKKLIEAKEKSLGEDVVLAFE